MPGAFNGEVSQEGVGAVNQTPKGADDVMNSQVGVMRTQLRRVEWPGDKQGKRPAQEEGD